MNQKDPIRKSILVLSLFCGVFLLLLGILSREIDTDYILLSIITFISAYLDPYIKLAYKRHKEKVAEEKRQKEEEIKRKAIQEKQKQKQIQEQIEFDKQQERERQEAIRIAQENLRKKASGKIRTSWNKNPSA